MKKKYWPLVVLLILIIAYLLGPDVEKPHFNRNIKTIFGSPAEAETALKRREASIDSIKPDNQARIIWNDSTHQKTPYSIVYLHGWSASYAEGDPLHFEMAKRYGCNLYLPRLAGHGLQEKEPMLNITAEKLMQSAKDAIAVGKVLGDKVILMATSTGGTLALYLAGGNPDIAGLILYSPNVDMYDRSSFILNKPWGLQIARLAKGGDYYQWSIDSAKAQYWTSKYRLEALTHLRELVDETMTKETFEAITQPVFVGYYYKNDTAQDHTVSVDAILRMYKELGTITNQKRKVAFPEAGHHVIASKLTSKDIDGVRKETQSFLEEIMGLHPSAYSSNQRHTQKKPEAFGPGF